jgi:tetratricopeptide (TPR) repeat protein/GGDEF domain-containing protein
MPDLNKLYEKAEKYLQKQKFESALETYLEIQKHQPTDEKVLLTLGDLALRVNRAADAQRFHSLLVDQYIKRNDVSKAVAMCRKILKSSPQDSATLVKLAALLEKLQKNSEALQAYRDALNLHRTSGATPQALDCLHHIVKLDPANPQAHVELGEIAGRARQLKVATPAFLQAAQLEKEAGHEDRWAELVERAHGLDPQNEAACLAAAQVFLKKDRASEAVSLLEPLARSKPGDFAVLEPLARAYLRVGNTAQAESLCWRVYQARPEAIGLLLDLADRLVRSGSSDRALDIVGKLKDRFFQQGKRNEFLQVIEKIYEADESNLGVLETLTNLYNEMSKEDGLRRSLTRLFNLHVAAEQYEKAAETLERIIDVEPYAEGHHDRLLNLEGHVDAVLYKNILDRVQPPSGAWQASTTAVTTESVELETADALEDLLVEGEMYLQYQLAPKLKATLEKIDRLYPGAQEKHTRLRELYEAAGFAPRPAPPAPASAAPGTPSAPPAHSLEEFKKISEITASIYRESTPQGVAQVAVNEIGRALKVTRCWAALGTEDRSPALTVEYCSPATSPSDINAALKLYAALMPQAAKNPDGWAVENAARAPLLAPILPEIEKLGVKSLLALPLIDREEPAGLLIAEQCVQARAWTAGESVLIKSIATQVVIAVNNTKLRRLVRSLSGTDEETGLLPRSSYLDCLLAEAQRAKELAQPLSICLLEADNPAALLKTLGDVGVQTYFRQVSKAVQSNLRQNDVAVRYNPCSIAVVFPDTALPQGGLAVEKLRAVISQVKLDGATSPAFCTAVCDVPLGPSFDAVDAVTEVINRLEGALDQSHREKGKRVLLSKFQG